MRMMTQQAGALRSAPIGPAACPGSGQAHAGNAPPSEAAGRGGAERAGWADPRSGSRQRRAA